MTTDSVFQPTVAVYWLACVAWPALLRKPILYGAIYGAVVYVVRNPR